MDSSGIGVIMGARFGRFRPRSPGGRGSQDPLKGHAKNRHKNMPKPAFEFSQPQHIFALLLSITVSQGF